MKALLMALDFPPNRPGGMCAYFAGLARHLPADSVAVLTGSARGSESTALPCPVHRAPVRSGGAGLVPLWLMYCLSAARKERPDLLICGNASPYKYVGYIAGRILRIPYVLCFFGNDVLRLSKRAGMRDAGHRIADRTIAGATAAIACSRSTADLAAQRLGFASERLIVCYPGVEPALPGSRTPAAPVVGLGEPLRLVSVGRLTARKGFDRTIEALGLLKARGCRVHYTIVGRGDQRPLRELAERTGVSDQVSFAGFLGSAGDVAREMLKAHVFVMVSRLAADGTDIEGFGTVYLEAGALKRPAIAGRSGGAPEAVVHMRTGLLVDDPDSAAGIAETVAMLARQPGLVGALGEQAYQRVQAEFLWPDIAARLYGKLQTLVAARSG